MVDETMTPVTAMLAGNELVFLFHFSRRSMGVAVFKCRPTSEEVTTALDRIMSTEKVRPKHLIVDQGPEFKCEHFENVWCKAMNILPRFGAVGKHGSRHR